MTKDDCDTELYAIRQTMMREMSFVRPFMPPSEKSIKALNIGLAKVVDSYQKKRGLGWNTKQKNIARKAFVAGVINLRDVQSSKVLSQWQVSVLIDYMKDNYDKMEDLLEYVIGDRPDLVGEAQVAQGGVAPQQIGVYVARDEAKMPDMRETDFLW